MLRRVDAVVKDQFAVVAIDVVEEELLVAHHGAVAHMQDEVITLTFKFSHHFARTVDSDHAGLIKQNGLGSAGGGLRQDRTIITRKNFSAAII